jgi:Ca-activated chloride channel family protein
MPGRTVLAALAVLIAVLLPPRLRIAVDAAAVADDPGVTIEGSVVDAGLAPIANAVITLERQGRAVATATCDPEGRFRFAGVAPARYTVRVTHPSFPAVVREMRVTNGARVLHLPIVMARPSDPDVQQALSNQEPPAPVRSSAAIGTPTVQGPARRPEPPATAPLDAAAKPVTQSGGRRLGRAGGTAESAVVPAPSGMGDERYARVEPNRFHRTIDDQLSTFGADVDTASYTNVRRFLSLGQLPPREAVRVEEFVNYFHFDYRPPRGDRPIAFTTEVGPCPWAPAHRLVLVGVRAQAPAVDLEGRNIVLLLDVSGSMAPPERLPMIAAALRMFVDTLRPDDRVAIVTYAGSSGVLLPSTPARHRGAILDAIDRLRAGGSTNGGQGLITAYRVAREAFVPGGVNRVVLATDGDFNVGIVGQSDLTRLIERERESGVFLSVMGVGSGNLKDATMERLADRGNGHYAYLDSLQEARRVLLHEADATLETVAKDVKFQVAFNAGAVSAWKLIGYENRALADRQFDDERADAGEMGANQTVTVLYEVVPAGVREDADSGDRRAGAGEWLRVNVRYKRPDGETSELLTQPARPGGRVEYLPFAAAVAEFGLLLRDEGSHPGRWDALAERVHRMPIPAAISADASAFADLVDIGRHLRRASY